MIIKKYEAATEQEAIVMAKEELGPEAIVMNIKHTKPRGIFKLFKKSKVEITAAIDGDNSEKTEASDSVTNSDKYEFGTGFASTKNEYNTESTNAIEEKINSIAMLLDAQMKLKEENAKKREKPNPFDVIAEKQASADKSNLEVSKATDTKIDLVADDVTKLQSEQNDKNAKVVNLVKDQLINNEVDYKIAEVLLGDANPEDKLPLDNVLANVYQKIVLKLGEVKPLVPSEKKPKIVFFVGNTGVGKTTTMAKLSSKYKAEKKFDIGMISVDVYRIAAIDQISEYASILQIPIEVAYTPEDMKIACEKLEDKDFIFVDTAGRSHNNEEQREDLKKIIESVDGYEKEIYLVLSATTKYSDLKSIASTYSELFDYKFIFTKLDETDALGNILNLKLEMDKELSYVTWGQNVPDDIGLLNPQVIAKKLLGGNN